MALPLGLVDLIFLIEITLLLITAMISSVTSFSRTFHRAYTRAEIMAKDTSMAAKWIFSCLVFMYCSNRVCHSVVVSS